MAKIPTKQLFDEYFATRDAEFSKKVRGQVDRPEVYAFETKVGKQLVEMNKDELFEMFESFSSNRTNSENFFLSYGTYDQIASLYRNVFAYYSDHYELIRNPWYDKDMRGMAASARLSKGKTAYTTATMLETIDIVRKNYIPQRADYIECIMLLFYEGIARAEEIVGITADQIDYRSKTIRMYGRIITLSDRCWELLLRVNGLERLDEGKKTFAVVPWHDSFFKFIVNKNDGEKFQDEPIDKVAAKLTRVLTMLVGRQLNRDVSYRTLYHLGFYDRLVDKYGKEKIDGFVTSSRDSEAMQVLVEEARRYGMKEMHSVATLKKNLLPFVS